MIFKAIAAGLAAGIMDFLINMTASHVLLRTLAIRSLITAFGVAFAVGTAIKATNILIKSPGASAVDRTTYSDQKISGVEEETAKDEERQQEKNEQETEKSKEHKESMEPDFGGSGEEEDAAAEEFTDEDTAKIADLISGSLDE